MSTDPNADLVGFTWTTDEGFEVRVRGSWPVSAQYVIVDETVDGKPISTDAGRIRPSSAVRRRKQMEGT